MLFNKQTPTNRQKRQPKRDVPARNTTTYSYHEARLSTEKKKSLRQINSSEKKLQTRWIRQLPSFIAIILILMSVIYELLLNSSPKIVYLTNNALSQKFLQSQSTYQQAAAKLLKSSVLNHTKLTINTDSIALQMQQKFPELASVSIVLPLIGQRPIVYIQAITPTLVLQTQDHSNYVVDSTGKVVARPTNSTQLPVALVVDQTGLNLSVGKPALPQNDVLFIQLVVGQLQAAHLAIQSLVLPSGSSRELDVHLTGQPYLVKFNLADSQSAKQQVGEFLAVEQSLKTKNITPAQYIDARIAGRVYYK